MNPPTLLDPAQDASDLIGIQPPAPQPAPASAPVQPSVPITATADTVAAPPVDRFGHLFRPGFHRVNADGTPFRGKKGQFMPRGGNRTPQGTAQPQADPQAVATATAPQDQAPAPGAPPIVEPAAPAWSEAERAAAAVPVAPVVTASATATAQAEVFDSSDDAAEVIALAVFFLIGLMFGAPEEATPSDGEQKKLVKITAGLIRATGWKGSAWWAAGLSWAAYILRVLRKPKASARVQAWVSDLRTKTKLAQPVPVAAPVAAPVQPSAPLNSKEPGVTSPTPFSGLFIERAAQ